MPTWIRPTSVEVDLRAIVHNAGAIASATGRPLYAVVKADGYGHGAAAVALALEQARAVKGFAVSLVEEGMALRTAGIRGTILVLGPSQHGGYDEVLQHNLLPVISHMHDANELAAAARRRDTTVAVHLKVDTGMGRLGLAQTEALALARTPGPLVPCGLMTHLASADVDATDDPRSLTARQLAAFAAIEKQLGLGAVERHVANSAGALLFPAARWDVTRVGLALYGGGSWPTPTPRQPAMRLVTRIAQIRVLEPGASVGYGATWTAQRATRAAIIPVGYADGYARAASNKAHVLVGGARCPTIGTISMDMIVVDVTDVPHVNAEADVVLLGRDNAGHEIRLADLAVWFGVTEYEVACGMSKRVPRVYANPNVHLY